jgi:DNA polymerase-1
VRPAFYIIDGHYHLYASYWAIRGRQGTRLLSADGEPTNAVYGFTGMLRKLLRERRPDYAAVVFDPPEPPARKADYPPYKEGRVIPEDLAPQLPRVLELIEAIGLPIFQVSGFEADDVIATLVDQAVAAGCDCYLCSRDADLTQLLGEHVWMFDTKKSEQMDAAAMREQLGYGPAEVPDVRALAGDSSDNIPGAAGVGPKTAAQLIGQFGSLEGVLEALDAVKGKKQQAIREAAEDLRLFKRLLVLRHDAPVTLDLPACRPDRGDPQRLMRLFERLSFRAEPTEWAFLFGESAAAQPGPEPSAPAAAKQERNYRRIDSAVGLDEFLRRLGEREVFAIDTETTSLQPVSCELVGISFSWAAGEGDYLVLAAPDGQPKLDRAQALEKLRPILEDEQVRKVGQNLKYDIQVFRTAGVELRGVFFDTMIASYLLAPGRASHKLDDLAAEQLGVKMIPIEQLIGKRGGAQRLISEVDAAAVAEYAAEDADMTWQLYERFAPQLEEAALQSLFADVEMPLVEVLADMEYAGVRIDARRLGRMSRQLTKRLEALTEQIHEAAGEAFNIDSPKQLGRVLFDKLELPVLKRTKTARSTDESVLERLAADHELPALVLAYRKLAKLKNTYVDALPAMVNPRTGRIHASFNQTVAETGRLSSSEPNLQNIPIRTEEGRKVRAAFVAPGDGQVLLRADYSQVELRILAHFCKDPVMRKAFDEDRDIHAFVAGEIFGCLPELVTKAQRSIAKTVNFGIIYGQTPFGLARTLGIAQSEARRFIDAYFKRFVGIRTFVEQTLEQARRDGYVTTILGRRRPIFGLRRGGRASRGHAERAAVNTVVQGSAADLIKVAMGRIRRRVTAERRPSRMILQVHDELVFEVPAEAVEAETAMIRGEMTDAIRFDVPLKVDVAWGPNWLETDTPA